MRKKLLKLACLCVMVSTLAMGGCGNSEDTKNSTNEVTTTKESDTKEEATTKKDTKEETTTTEDTTEDKAENQSGEYPYGTFDFDEVCKHIMINGKQVDFPFTLNDLGDDYKFVRCDDGYEGIYGGFISYKGEEILMMACEEENELDRDSVISDISIYCEDVNKKDIINICGIQKGSEMEKVIETFGEPTVISEDSFSGLYYYKSEKGFVRFSYFKDNELVDDCKIIISSLEQEEN